jgi:hypothetical protein
VDQLFLLSGGVPRDQCVEDWFLAPGEETRRIIQPWFDHLRACGSDVRELLHDGRPTACVGNAAFAYVDAFSAHAAVGFYFCATLHDPANLLEGKGKRMRHVKLRWGEHPKHEEMNALIAAAYDDVRSRLCSSD